MAHRRKSGMPRMHSTSHRKEVSLNDKMEVVMKDFLARFAEASYNVALKLGFRGSFITFLSDLQEALEEVLKKDKMTMHHGTKIHASHSMGKSMVH